MEGQRSSEYSLDKSKQYEIVNTIRKILSSSHSESERNQICFLIQTQVESSRPKIDTAQINYYKAKNMGKFSFTQSNAQDINNGSISSGTASQYQRQLAIFIGDYPQYFNQNYSREDNQSQILLRLSNSYRNSNNEVEISMSQQKQDTRLQNYVQSHILSLSKLVNNKDRFLKIISKMPEISKTSPVNSQSICLPMKQFSEINDKATQIKYKKQLQEKLLQIKMLLEQKQSCTKLLQVQQIALRDKSQQSENFKTRLERVKGYLSQQKEIIRRLTQENQQLRRQLSLRG